jgi:hypothetical protein
LHFPVRQPGSEAASGRTRDATPRSGAGARNQPRAELRPVHQGFGGRGRTQSVEAPEVATASQCGDRVLAVSDKTNDTAATRFRRRNRKHARGPGRHGVSRPERNRRRNRRRRRYGNKIRTRGAPQIRQPPACRRKRNLRGKRQDPWRGANDRVRKRAVPTLRTTVGLQNLLQMRADPVWPRCAGRCTEDRAQKPHPTSHQCGRNPAVAGSAAGPERFATVRAGRRSVGKLTAGDTRRVKPSAKCQ